MILLCVACHMRIICVSCVSYMLIQSYDSSVKGIICKSCDHQNQHHLKQNLYESDMKRFTYETPMIVLSMFL